MSTQSDANLPGSFWPRQFAAEATGVQTVVDVFGGIVLPLICLYFDPIVFRDDSGFSMQVFGDFQVLAYLTIAIAILALAFWLSLKRPNALLSGFLLGNAVFAGVIGIVLLPLSLIFVAVGIGLLGLIPFLTAFVYLRNGVRVWRRLNGGRMAATLAAVGAIIAMVGPPFAQRHVNHKINEGSKLVLSPDAEDAARGYAILERYSNFGSLTPLVWAYFREKDQGRRQQISDTYRLLTGKEVESRLFIVD